MSYRWLVQTLKKNPEATLEDIEKLIEPSERALRRERMAREGPIAFKFWSMKKLHQKKGTHKECLSVA